MSYELTNATDLATVRTALGLGGTYRGSFASRTALVSGATSPAAGDYALVGAAAPYVVCQWNGLAWVAPTQIIAQSAVPVPFTGSTSASVIATVTIPGGIMGPNGALRIYMDYSMTNNANAKRMLVRYGGAGTSFYNANLSSTAEVIWTGMIHNRGATGSQILAGAGGTANSFGTLTGQTVSSEDTTASQNIQFVVTLANAADTVTLERYSIELVG